MIEKEPPQGDSEVIRALQDRHIFHFETEAKSVIDEFVHQMAESNMTPMEDPEYLTRRRNHMQLAAAEFALSPLFARPPQAGAFAEPISVNEECAAIGALKYDCCLIRECGEEENAEDTGPDRATIFSADATRIFRLSGIWRNPEIPPGAPSGPMQLHAAVMRIERIYWIHPARISRDVARSQVVRLQGLLWRLQLTVAGFPGFSGSLSEALDDSWRALIIKGPPWLES